MKEKIIKLIIGIFFTVLLLTFILSGCSAVRSSAQAVAGAADGQAMEKSLSESPSMPAADGAAAATTAAAATVNSGSELYTEAGSADSAAIQVISCLLYTSP